MKRLLTIAALLLFVLAASAALAAQPPGKNKNQTSTAEAKAERACQAERGTTAQGAAAFNEKHGTNKNKKNGFGKCVSSKSKDDDEEDEAAEDKNENGTNASKKCKAERGTTAASIAAFAMKHGTNNNKKNAHGKCVSKSAKQKS